MNTVKISRVRRKTAQDVLEWLLLFGKDWVSLDNLKGNFATELDPAVVGIAPIVLQAMGLYGGSLITLERLGYVEERQRNNPNTWNYNRQFRLTQKAMDLLEKYDQYNQQQGNEHDRRSYKSSKRRTE